MNSQTQTDKATARPWRIGQSARTIDIKAGHNALICRVENNFDGGEDNAALIVRAVNSYDALLAVAEAAKKLTAAYASDGNTKRQKEGFAETRAALAAVQGKESK